MLRERERRWRIRDQERGREPTPSPPGRGTLAAARSLAPLLGGVGSGSARLETKSEFMGSKRE